MSLSDYCREPDKFEIAHEVNYTHRADFAFPCCVCDHAERDEREEPCASCGHNCNAPHSMWPKKRGNA